MYSYTEPQYDTACVISYAVWAKTRTPFCWLQVSGWLPHAFLFEAALKDVI
jgi:hypothetical protein